MGIGIGGIVKVVFVFFWKLYRNVFMSYRWLMGYMEEKGKKRFRK